MMMSTDPSMNVPAASTNSTIITITRSGLAGEVEDPPGDRLGDALEHDAVAEDRRQREQEHHRADVGQAAGDRVDERAQREHAVGEPADRDGVDHGERADLRGREHAHAQAQQQDHREQDRPDAGDRRAHDLARRGQRLRAPARSRAGAR